MKYARESDHRRRRSRQGFRSQELLASLTLSAEAITLRNESGNPEEAAARAASRATKRRSRSKFVRSGSSVSKYAAHDVASVAGAKLLAMKKLKSMRKYRLGVHGSLREDEEDDNEVFDEPPTKSRHKSLAPMVHAMLPGLLQSSRTPTSPTKTLREKHAIGNFETLDRKWKATIEGEVEKFMYPSLRLENLYSQEDGLYPKPINDTNENIKPMPSPKTIDDVLTSTSKVNWELEHVTPSSAPVVPIQEINSRRQIFDQKLQDAEVALRKRESASLRLSNTPQSPENSADVLPASKSSSLDTLMVKEIVPSFSHNLDVPRQQPIPRLPQARK
ncbi:hypothetical protein PHMEG_0004266 [Phytophthora megakarya]|uniref:Uncharacterized protein n=1 Tax=Phytophthora megakarya TaxID=4795 RepID=A0A225WVX0_9STRA|nr:hypothetical protein PHMEG_0004266 [Phytophthora megakarya]